MKKILAVSGGIDSIVMLHLFRNDSDVIVAHFDHGIRPNSAEDCLFVKRLAEQYKKDFYYESVNLGDNCSEETARRARYEFLSTLAAKHKGKIYTAHHSDDLIESAAINLLRGTGWRGLAALNNENIERPLLDWSKADIYKYATKNQLHFRLDQTNSDEKYLRNRVRQKLSFANSDDKTKLKELAMRQRTIAREIDEILQLIQGGSFRRDLLQVDDDIAIEMLRIILAQKHITQTRPQLTRAIYAVREYDANKKFPLNKEFYIKIGRYNFHIESAKIATEG